MCSIVTTKFSTIHTCRYAFDIAAVTPKILIAIAIHQLFYPGVYHPIDSLVYCFQNKVRNASDRNSVAYTVRSS